MREKVLELIDVIKQFEAKLEFYEHIRVYISESTIYLKFTRQNEEWSWLLKEVPLSDIDFIIKHYKNKLDL